MAKKKKNKKEKKPIKKKNVKLKKKRKRASSPKVLAHVNATYNNTIISITDYNGDVIAWSSCGAIGFTGSRKSTVYASTQAGHDAAEKALQAGAREVEVVVKGIGMGRQAAIKGMRAAGLRITRLMDKTPIPHGGCRPRNAPKK